jgi:hypothetical protein
MVLYLFNCPIITDRKNWGTYTYEPCTLDEAKQLIQHARTSADEEVVSSIGHASTAELMTKLLEFDVKVDRRNDTMEEGDAALVMSLNKRCDGGTKELTVREIEEEYGFSFGIMRRNTRPQQDPVLQRNLMWRGAVLGSLACVLSVALGHWMRS